MYLCTHSAAFATNYRNERVPFLRAQDPWYDLIRCSCHCSTCHTETSVEGLVLQWNETPAAHWLPHRGIKRQLSFLFLPFFPIREEVCVQFSYCTSQKYLGICWLSSTQTDHRCCQRPHSDRKWGILFCYFTSLWWQAKDMTTMLQSLKYLQCILDMWQCKG